MRNLAALVTPVMLALWLGSSAPAAAEIMLGLTGGLVIPGDQDLVFQEYPEDGGFPATDRVIGQKDVDESLGPLVGATVTAWGDWSFLRYFALQLEPMYWSMQAKGAPSPPAPRFTVHEQRVAVFFSVLARLPVYPEPGRFSGTGRDSFAYLGAGLGPVHSSVSHGASSWDLGYQLLAGVSIPVVSKLRVRLEGRYILAADVDTISRDSPGWRVDTSGFRRGFTPNRYTDTQFIPLLVGVDWRF